MNLKPYAFLSWRHSINISAPQRLLVKWLMFPYFMIIRLSRPDIYILIIIAICWTSLYLHSIASDPLRTQFLAKFVLCSLSGPHRATALITHWLQTTSKQLWLLKVLGRAHVNLKKITHLFHFFPLAGCGSVSARVCRLIRGCCSLVLSGSVTKACESHKSHSVLCC